MNKKFSLAFLKTQKAHALFITASAFFIEFNNYEFLFKNGVLRCLVY